MHPSRDLKAEPVWPPPWSASPHLRSSDPPPRRAWTYALEVLVLGRAGRLGWALASLGHPADVPRTENGEFALGLHAHDAVLDEASFARHPPTVVGDHLGLEAGFDSHEGGTTEADGEPHRRSSRA